MAVPKQDFESVKNIYIYNKVKESEPAGNIVDIDILDHTINKLKDKKTS